MPACLINFKQSQNPRTKNWHENIMVCLTYSLFLADVGQSFQLLVLNNLCFFVLLNHHLHFHFNRQDIGYESQPYK